MPADLRFAPRPLAAVAVLAALLSVSPRSHAAAEEIQVYLDDLSAPGQFGLDVHNNDVFSGDKSPSYPGEQPPFHVYRLTPEFYYGLSDTLELGAYLLSTRDPAGAVHFDGEKLRLKFIAPHDEKAGLFWGANLEVGRSDLRVAERPWNAELKGILGYRTGPWLLAVNPNLDWSLSAHGGPATTEVDLKIAYELRPGTQIGVETYDELGPVTAPSSLHANSHVPYLAYDGDFGRFDVNVGIGHGLTGASDQWVFKFIIGTHFGGR